MVNNPILYAAIMTLWHVALPVFLIFFKCLWNCECYVTCYNITCLFTYFGFIESHYNSSVRLVKLKLQNLNSQYQYAYWKVPTPELMKLGVIFLNCRSLRIFAVSAPC